MVRDDQPGAQVGAVRDHGRPGRVAGRSDSRRIRASALLPGAGWADAHHQAGVGIDNELHVGREPVVT